MVSLVNQGCKSQSLSSTPIDSFTFLNRLLSSLEYLYDLRVELVSFLRQFCDICSDLIESVEWNPSIVKEIKFFVVFFDLGPLFSHPLLLIKRQRLTLCVCLFHFVVACFLNCFELSFRYTLFNKLLSV